MRKVLIVIFIIVCLFLCNVSVFALDSEEDVLPPVDPENYDVYEGEVTLVGDVDENEGRISTEKIVIYIGIGVLALSSGIFVYKRTKNKNNEE